MNNDSTQKQCDSCGTAVPTYDGVYLSDELTNRFLCSKCYNESVSEAIGLNFDHLSFHPVTFSDKDGAKHTFHFQTRLFGDNVLIQALEIKDGEPKGYEFSVHGDVEDELFGLFGKLVKRIRRELERRHIEPSDQPFQGGNSSFFSISQNFCYRNMRMLRICFSFSHRFFGTSCTL